MGQTKTCSRCPEAKQLDDFYKPTVRRDGGAAVRPATRNSNERVMREILERWRYGSPSFRRCTRYARATP
jgi:hypothetical protein